MAYVLIFIAGFIAVSLWSFWLILRPQKILSPRTPDDVGLTYESISLVTEDRLTLDAWFIPHAHKREVALIVIHGYPADKGDMLDIAHDLAQEFSVLLFDLRYFGKSEGAYTTLGSKEKMDIAAGISFLKSRGITKIGVLGFSLGGAAALMEAAENQNIRAVAAYGTFADLKLLGYDTYTSLWILKYPLVELLSLWADIFLGYDLEASSPRVSAQTLALPIFLVHSKEDEQIPFRHAVLLKESLSHNANAEFYFLEEGLHGHLPIDFEKRVREFFRKYLF